MTNPPDSFSIIVPSCGRPSLRHTLASISNQMMPGDELLVDVNSDGDYGGTARNRMIAKATGDYLLFNDDDDLYARDAFADIRSTIVPNRVNIYRMRYNDGRELWREPKLECGNVSTQMAVVPRYAAGKWDRHYEADFDFIRMTCVRLSARGHEYEPVWHDNVIALIRPGI